MRPGGQHPERKPLCGCLQQNLFDEQRSNELRKRFRSTRSWGDLRRLREFQNVAVSHDCVWKGNPAHGGAAQVGESGLDVCKRLGASLAEEQTLCPRCGQTVVEIMAALAGCVVSSAGMHGRSEARDKVLGFVQFACLGQPQKCLRFSRPVWQYVMLVSSPRLGFQAVGRRWTPGPAHQTRRMLAWSPANSCASGRNPATLNILTRWFSRASSVCRWSWLPTRCCVRRRRIY